MSSALAPVDPPDEPDPAERLLIAAGPVFAERGFDRATVREIASVASVNVAAVSYYFGEKMGLYRAVIARIRQKREQAFPIPDPEAVSPETALEGLVRTMLSRMLADDESGWESILMMREMQNPTIALDEVIQEYFRPLYDALRGTIERLLSMNDLNSPDDQRYNRDVLIPQIALSVVGQCLYYRVGKPVVEKLIPESIRSEHFDSETLTQHITAMTLAACGQDNVAATRCRQQAISSQLKDPTP